MSEHIQQFTQQLASWSRTIIEFGRLPFRRVETYPTIATDLGTVQPPLVFWINRQSLMAGGILLIPETGSEPDLELGCACCEALGLKHFVTWEARQVRIWQTDNRQVSTERCLPLQAPEQPDTFRYLLEDVLNALKLLAIIGAVPPQKLAPQYFNNLFQITLEQTAQSLIEDYRKLRSEHDDFRKIDLDYQAHEANRIFLLKILALLLFDELPGATQPEKLEEVIDQCVGSLPAELSSILLQPGIVDAPALPLSAAIGFHHLLMRLQQLSWAENTDRAVHSLNQLISSWYPARNICLSGDICINPAAPQNRDFSSYLLSDQLPVLAATGLLARASSQALPQLIFGSVFLYQGEMNPSGTVSARLLDQNLVTGQERQDIAISLRKAWPSRRFKIRAGQPRWLWEFIYLLGVTPGETKLHLELPLSALKTPGDGILWQVLAEHCAIDRILKNSEQEIILQIRKSPDQADSLQILTGSEERILDLPIEAPQLRTRILLTLLLPDEVFRLLGEEITWYSPEVAVESPRGWELYTRSKLFQLFRAILSSSTKVTRETTTFKPEEVPCPDLPYIKELALTSLRNNSRQASIDKLLADLLNKPILTNLEIPRQAQATDSQLPATEITEEMKENLKELILAHGRPDFPEQYFYFLEQPQLVSYRLTPPLVSKGSILGQFELEDANGQRIEGYGEELEQALMICAEIGKKHFELPSDRYQLTRLLEYYKKDLGALYKTLEQHCYSLIENPQAARKQIQVIWQELQLPGPGWFKNR